MGIYMKPLIYINGKFYPKDEAKISVFDHGFLYGDGVFEGIRIYYGGIFKLEEHLRRLYRSARIIGLEIPISFKELREAVIETVRVNAIKEGYIRLVVTRGEGDLGLDPRKCTKPNIIIIAVQMPRYIGKPIKAIIASIRRTPHQCLPPHAKTLNYLNNILAKIEAIGAGTDEAIMLDIDGYVAEATGENLFIVREETLATPPTSSPILVGITRESIMDMARELDIHVEERKITVDELYVADEIFLCGTAAEIMPVLEINGRKVGNGTVGTITKRLIDYFDQYVRKHLTPINI